MTHPPKRTSDIPCGEYEMARVWARHIQRQRQRNSSAWEEPQAGSVPCEHCGWSKYLHDVAKRVNDAHQRQDSPKESDQ